MIEWGGWKFDELRDEVVAPARVRFSRFEAKAFGMLLRAKGAIVSKEDIGAECGSKNVAAAYALMGSIFRKLREAGLPLPITKFNMGYSLPVADGYDAVSREVAVLLVRELEATQPHAAALSAKISKLYRGGSA